MRNAKLGLLRRRLASRCAMGPLDGFCSYMYHLAPTLFLCVCVCVRVCVVCVCRVCVCRVSCVCVCVCGVRRVV